MKKKHTVWKVVRRCKDGLLRSAWVLTARVVYVPGKVTATFTGPLFAFESLEDAEWWRTSWHARGWALEIWKAYGVGIREVPAILDLPLDCSVHEYEIAEWWAGRREPPSKMVFPPVGTVICDKLVLLRRYA